MTKELKAKTTRWLIESASVETWNDTTKLYLFEQSKKIVSELLTELAELTKKIKEMEGKK